MIPKLLLGDNLFLKAIDGTITNCDIENRVIYLNSLKNNNKIWTCSKLIKESNVTTILNFGCNLNDMLRRYDMIRDYSK